MDVWQLFLCRSGASANCVLLGGDRMLGLSMWAHFTPDIPRSLDAPSSRGVGPTLELMRTAYCTRTVRVRDLFAERVPDHEISILVR